VKEIRVLPAVLRDLAEAAAWYDEESSSRLGDRLIATFYSYLPQVQESGEIYRKAYLEFRKILIRPFPYAVYTGFMKMFGLLLC